MKRIVLAIGDLRGAGAQRFVLTMAKAFLDEGCEAHVVLLRNLIKLPIPDGIKIHVFQGLHWIPRFAREWRICRQFTSRLFDKFLIRQCDGPPSLVLSNAQQTDLMLASSRLNNVYLVVHSTLSHSEAHAKRSAARRLQSMRGFYRQKDAIAVGEGVCEDFSKLFPECRIRLIHNPVDRADVLAQSCALSSNSLPPELPSEFMVHVGSLKPAKRHDILLQAYAQSGIEMPLVVVGAGPLLKDMKALAMRLGVADRVFFMGFCTNPFPIMKKAAFMVVSSDFEGFSIAILEALALDLPVLSTDCPSGPSEVLPPDNLVPVRDVDALAQKIKHFAADPHRYHVPFDEKFLPAQAARKYLALAR